MIKTNERIKEIRKALGLNQQDFGHRVGVTVTAISKVEKGINRLSDQLLLAVCREFNVNEEWLRHGTGKMFVISEEGAISELVEKYKLDDFAARALLEYQKLPPAIRTAIKEYAIAVVASYGVDLGELRKEAEIDAMGEAYKEELRAAKDTATSSASPNTKEA